MSRIGHVVLAGLPGAGKTTVAPLLAARMGRQVVDTDTEIERRLGMTPAQVFAELGETRFRAEERRTMEEALSRPEPLVIAAGGGLMAQPGAAEILMEHATVVLLDAGDEQLLHRLGPAAALRPLLAQDPAGTLHRLRSVREAAHGHAQMRVWAGDRSPDEIAAHVARALTGAVRVATAQPYLVRAATAVSGSLAEHLPVPVRRVALIADEAVSEVAEAMAVRLRRDGLAAVVLPLPGGEATKQWSVAGSLLERCSDAGLERGDCIVAVGGGSVGDVAGLVAATYLRGIAWVVVPTTLLAMVDSAVGGKTGVNLRRGKNLAGVFWQPRAVLCDPELLGTLSERSFRSAFAEIIKASMIGGSQLAETIETHLPAALARDPAALTELVLGCCDLKAGVVAGDERESGRRAILNYGHTAGHAVEALTGLGSGLDHGEAVAFGMRVAGALSVLETGCPAADVAHQAELLDACGLSVRPRLNAGEIAEQLVTDKKARGGVPRWVLLRGRGRPVAGIVVEPEAIRQALTEALVA
jgi:shikimate kinase/3-dehydroquinate synthase